MRVDELCALEADAAVVFGERNALRIHVGKLHTDRCIPLHPWLDDAAGDVRYFFFSSFRSRTREVVLLVPPGPADALGGEAGGDLRGDLVVVLLRLLLFERTALS